MSDSNAFRSLVVVASKLWELENGGREGADHRGLDPPNTVWERTTAHCKDIPRLAESDENVDPNESSQGDATMYWMEPNWVPTNNDGSQTSPAEIRKQLESFIATSDRTKTSILASMGVNSNSFRKFMTKQYKDPWRAVENGTYWAAARMVRKQQRFCNTCEFS